MRKTLLMTTGLAWLALTGAAGAVTVTLTAGPANPTYFSGTPVGSSNFMVGGDTWSLLSGSAAVQVGSLSGVYADPLGMTNPYMAVEGGGTEQVVFGTAQTSISIYWGSIDAAVAGSASAGNINDFAITVDGYTLTGQDLMTIYGAHGTGSHSDPLANQMVTISGLGAFTTATFTTTHNAFEFSLGATPVPEPSTWAMMTLGFAGLGYAAFRRNSTKSRALAI
jgi:PEP-CTERM motif